MHIRPRRGFHRNRTMSRMFPKSPKPRPSKSINHCRSKASRQDCNRPFPPPQPQQARNTSHPRRNKDRSSPMCPRRHPCSSSSCSRTTWRHCCCIHRPRRAERRRRVPGQTMVSNAQDGLEDEISSSVRSTFIGSPQEKQQKKRPGYQGLPFAISFAPITLFSTYSPRNAK